MCKAFVTLLFPLLPATGAFAQRRPEPPGVTEPYSPDWYLRKSRRQKVVALSSLGSGLTLSLIGVFMLKPDYRDIYQVETEAQRMRRKARERTGVGLTVGGLALVAGSIPLFVASGRNRRLARVVLAPEAALLPYPAARHSFAAMHLRIAL
ncbi:hypothetical protein EPD60_06805 [Flaviaesturariibacter flavus]|uniref:Uncharacterized protein n=1 Tax=Flaviaesturariibacter flavus TaxID=2502780 RepID=A0A4R1B940_9BACT|nr:hypothetical protein [Flaviaesturariibacter flavus]TCJ13089.1 hypothetical protein EPD60_13545 [Flaviaesturariibacter flavus]TCJ17013.1 hypothetical protein EPD60_06805 [Flaviaesturariibacter flavus]